MNSDIMMKKDEFCTPKIPTLVDLCAKRVIDNVRYNIYTKKLLKNSKWILTKKTLYIKV